MAKTRILYGLFLLAAVVFHSFYTGWFSFFLLVFAVLLPFFSLLVSLPAMLRAAYEAELPVRCFCGQSVQYRLLAHHAAKLPVSRCRLRLTVSDAVSGEVRQQKLELAGTIGFALRIDTRFSACRCACRTPAPSQSSRNRRSPMSFRISAAFNTGLIIQSPAAAFPRSTICVNTAPATVCMRCIGSCLPRRTS